VGGVRGGEEWQGGREGGGGGERERETLRRGGEKKGGTFVSSSPKLRDSSTASNQGSSNGEGREHKGTLTSELWL
jgi:hypothetical protein